FWFSTTNSPRASSSLRKLSRRSAIRLASGSVASTVSSVAGLDGGGGGDGVRSATIAGFAGEAATGAGIGGELGPAGTGGVFATSDCKLGFSRNNAPIDRIAVASAVPSPPERTQTPANTPVSSTNG